MYVDRVFTGASCFCFEFTDTLRIDRSIGAIDRDGRLGSGTEGADTGSNGQLVTRHHISSAWRYDRVKLVETDFHLADLLVQIVNNLGFGVLDVAFEFAENSHSGNRRGHMKITDGPILA